MNQRRLKLVKRAGLLGAGVLLLLALVWAFVPAAITVETAPVARKPFEQTVLEDGKTRVKTKYVISTPVAGTLLRIDLKPGDRVTRGMTVATIVPGAAPLIDPRSEQELRARLGSAQAAQARAETSVGRARAAQDLAQGEYSRSLQLAASGTASQADLERAQSELRVRQKEYEAARFDAEVAGHEVEVARTALLQLSDPRGSRSSTRRVSVKSDVDGRVLRVTQESEATLPVGAPILELADAHDLEIVVDVLSTDGVQIAPGTRVRIERWGGPVTLEGRVRLVEPGAFTKVSALGVEEQRVNMIADIVSPPEQWRTLGDGFRIEADIVIFSTPDALVVPIGALFRVGEQWAVYVVEDRRARRRLLTLGRRNSNEASVESGLQPGQTVILYPSDQLSDGGRVRTQ
jgi:HlyD family secretion protein